MSEDFSNLPTKSLVETFFKSHFKIQEEESWEHDGIVNGSFTWSEDTSKEKATKQASKEELLRRGVKFYIFLGIPIDNTFSIKNFSFTKTSYKCKDGKYRTPEEIDELNSITEATPANE